MTPLVHDPIGSLILVLPHWLFLELNIFFNNLSKGLRTSIICIESNAPIATINQATQRINALKDSGTMLVTASTFKKLKSKKPIAAKTHPLIFLTFCP
jgi:hypothetical protein